MTTFTTSAGILSSLSKLGKASKKIDVDAPSSVIRQIEIPEVYKNLNTTDLIPNSTGSWDIRLTDGRRASLDDLIAAGEDLSQHALLVRSIDVPQEMSYFNKLPKDIPVLISNRNQQVFEFIRGSTPSLKYKNISIPLDTATSIRTSLYNFDKPLLASSPRFISLSEKSTTALPDKLYATKALHEKTSIKSLLIDLDKIKNQNIVLSGKISDGKLFAGKQTSTGVLISDLTELATKNDINLVILESAKPDNLLKSLAKKNNTKSADIANFNQSTGDFFNQIAGSKNMPGLEVSFSNSGRSQVAISSKTDDTHFGKSSNNNTQAVSGYMEASTTADIITPTALRLLITSIRIYRPDENRSLELAILDKERERQKNKDEFRQILPWLYIVISVFTGFWAIEYVNQLWRKIWPKPNPQKYYNRFIYGLVQASRFIFYLLLLLPLVGLPCAILKILITLKNIFVFIFISPIKWVISKFQ